MMMWIAKHPYANADMLGLVPEFLSEDDPRPAKEQIAANYIGGWHPFPGFKLLPDGNLKYPGDPPTELLFMTKLRDEIIQFYDHSWLLVMQTDGSYEVSRVD